MAHGARLPLPVSPMAAGVARSFVRDCWSHLETPETIEDVALCVSELVTNALDHAIPPFELRVSRQPGCLRVEIEDASDQRPVMREFFPGARRGRGIFLVATVATRWGVEPTKVGKTVWAEFLTNGLPNP